MPQIRENEQVVSRPRRILNETWSGISQATISQPLKKKKKIGCFSK